MRYNELIAILYEKFEIKGWKSDDSPAIMDIRLLDRNEHQWNEQVLYIGSLANCTGNNTGSNDRNEFQASTY